MGSVFVWAKPSPAPTAITMGLVDVIAPSTGGVPINISMGYITIMDLYTAGPSVSVQGLGYATMPTELTTTRPAHWNDAATNTPVDMQALQALVNAPPSPGDIIELDKDTIYSGKLTIPATCKGTSGAGEIIIRTSDWSALNAARPAGTRVLAADTQYMPKVQGVDAAGAAGRAISIEASSDGSGGASYIRFIGLDIKTAATESNPRTNLVAIGSELSGKVAADLPTNIIFDQCLVHGNTLTDIENGVNVNCRNFGLVDSRVYEIHSTGQNGGIAVFIYNGAVSMVRNNYLAAADTVINLSDQFQTTEQPQDIVIRGNQITKNTAWDGTWTGKNCFETKWCNRVLLENNVLSNCTWTTQANGDGVYLKTAGTGHATENVTIRFNVIHHCDTALSFLMGQASSGNINRIHIYNNLFYDCVRLGSWGPEWNETEVLTYLAMTNNTFEVRRSGKHTGANNAATLTDSNAHWTAGKFAYDIVTNDTDGSSAGIGTTALTTITFDTAITGGTDNDFDTGDNYTISAQRYPSLSGQIANCADWIIRDNLFDAGGNGYFYKGGIGAGTAGLNSACTGSYTLTYNLFLGGTSATYNAGAQAGSTASNNQVPATRRDIQYDASFGAHTAGNGQAILTDSGQAWTSDALIGRMLRNVTDGSSGIVTDNDGTTVTAALTGGTNNDWDTNDIYMLEPNAVGDFALEAGSTYVDQSSSGGPIGCDIATLLTAISGVEE